MNINDLIHISFTTAVKKGWHDEKRSIPELLCLIHSEISEALEEHRAGHHPNDIYYKDNKPEGIPIELADAVIRIADICGLYDIDLEKAINTKIEYNKNRSYRHGNKKC